MQLKILQLTLKLDASLAGKGENNGMGYMLSHMDKLASQLQDLTKWKKN